MPTIAARVQPRDLFAGMNKLERKWAIVLEAQKRDGIIADWKYEHVKLRLADNTFLTPDFFVVEADGYIRIDETKGFWEEDARVKIKVAAAMYPFRWRGIRERRVRDGGGWDIEEFSR